MTNAPDTQTLYLGLKLYEWLTLAGIIVGPVVAVALTLITQEHSQKRERKMHVLRMLMASRRLPSDPTYSLALNLAQVEFNDKPKVRAALTAYFKGVRFFPTEAGKAAHDAELAILQTKLIYAVMQTLGLRISETDIQADAYIADGFIFRDNLYLDSLVAMRQIADELKAQSAFLRGQMGGERAAGPDPADPA